jgi:hypothetical protein
MAAARQWTVTLEDGEHFVFVGPDNPTTGWPKAFSCDAREYPIKIAFKRGRRFEFPFPIGQHSGVLVMSKAQPPPYLTAFKAALASIWRGPSASVDAVQALRPWGFELLVDGQPVSSGPDPSARSLGPAGVEAEAQWRGPPRR